MKCLKNQTKKMKKLLIALLFLATTASAQKRNLKPDDIYKIKTTGGGLISPDGNWFLYTLTTIDSAKNNRNTDLWMMSWDGNENIQLTNSPDGEGNAVMPSN
jgi:Tol biopolymer transport system component